MARLVLDSGGVTRLAKRSPYSLSLIAKLRNAGTWPPTVLSPVLVECLEGHAGRDALENRFLKSCEIAQAIPEPLARRAATLRRMARCGSAIDALVVAGAEPGGYVLTSDPLDIQALAAHALDVHVIRV